MSHLKSDATTANVTSYLYNMYREVMLYDLFHRRYS